MQQYTLSTNELTAAWCVTALVLCAIFGVIHRLEQLEIEESERKSAEIERRFFVVAESLRQAEQANTLSRGSDCQNCRNYHGMSYYGQVLVCAIHPDGMENCPDWEPLNK